jgi:hypothetical protein
MLSKEKLIYSYQLLFISFNSKINFEHLSIPYVDMLILTYAQNRVIICDKESTDRRLGALKGMNTSTGLIIPEFNSLIVAGAHYYASTE